MSAPTRRQALADAAILGGLGVLALASPATGAPAAGAPALPAPTGKAGDFDFLVGTWNGANRRLKQRWAGAKLHASSAADDWDEFPGILHCENRLNGLVNIDQADFPTKGWSGVTVRTCDLAQRRWSIYWISSKTGALYPPVVGSFTGDHGEFYGDDTDDGRPVKVQFLWSRVSADVVRWAQAFSLDGAHWVTNWTVEHRRAR